MIKFTRPRTQQVSLYMDKFSGVCQSVLHECKLTFLQIISDHDLFVEMPGRDPSDRYSPLDTHLFIQFSIVKHFHFISTLEHIEIEHKEATSAVSICILEKMQKREA